MYICFLNCFLFIYGILVVYHAVFVTWKPAIKSIIIINIYSLYIYIIYILYIHFFFIYFLNCYIYYIYIYTHTINLSIWYYAGFVLTRFGTNPVFVTSIEDAKPVLILNRFCNLPHPNRLCARSKTGFVPSPKPALCRPYTNRSKTGFVPSPKPALCRP